MTHLVDTSVWQKYGRFPGVTAAIDELDEAGAIFSTCPPVVAEYCFSAQNAFELQDMQQNLDMFFRLDGLDTYQYVNKIQRAMWKHGYLRGAGAMDTHIAAYALAADQFLVTCDRQFLSIGLALRKSRSSDRLRVLYISEMGEVHSAGG